MAKTKTTNWLVAAVLAWLVPGAGHFYLGRPVRGAIIFIVIAATFWSGVAIGGVLTVDYYNSRWWFIAQMWTGVHGLIGYERQKSVYSDVMTTVTEKLGQSRENVEAQYIEGISENVVVRQQDRERLDNTVSMVDSELQRRGVAFGIYATENVARAYAGVAGMLNLLCVIDALILSLMGVYGESSAAAEATGKGAS